MDDIAGRKHERESLGQLYTSRKSEFLAVVGRRRIGKTFLIREHFKIAPFYLEVTGQKDTSKGEQLEHFTDVFLKAFSKSRRVEPPRSWPEALRNLADAIEGMKRKKGKIVLFFDELPWLASRRSGFMQALEHFWNVWASKRKDILLIVCGSAASWMIQKVVHNKGGLHNRITSRMRLLPFTLAETEEFLAQKRVSFQRKQILELYMAFGGVPHYLEQVRRGLSVEQAIDRICFSKDGGLVEEFDELYDSLFENSERYKAIIRVLGKQRSGVQRDELLKTAGIRTGGTATKILNALEESGFIASTVPFGNKAKSAVYRLTDEYSLFYLTWIERAPKGVLSRPPSGYWIQQRAQPKWRAWAGYTFESICLNHVYQIKKGLSIAGISTIDSGWAYRPVKKSEQGVQIDLVIDRSDNCVDLCEMKFSDIEFVIDKRYAETLRRKKQVFLEMTRTRKVPFIVMVTTYGLKQNAYCEELIDQQLTMDVLFS